MYHYNYSTRNIANALKARAYGKPFYASDLGFNGGEMNGLHLNGFVKPTGNTRKVMVPIDRWGGDRIFKECEVKEWVWCRSERSEWERAWQDNVIIDAIEQAKALLETAQELGVLQWLGLEG